MASNYTIQDQNKYFFQIPNCIFDIGLPVIAIAIYCAIKRIGGDHGGCTKSIENLAKMCGVKTTCLHKYLKILSTINPILNKPLITIIHRKSEAGDPETNLIMITDIWPENMAMYSKGGGSPREGGVVRDAKEGGSPREGKEESIEEEQCLSVCAQAPNKKLNLVFRCSTPGFGVDAISEELLYETLLREMYSKKEISEAIVIAQANRKGVQKGSIINFVKAIIENNRMKFIKKENNGRKDNKQKNDYRPPANEPSSVRWGSLYEEYSQKNAG